MIISVDIYRGLLSLIMSKTTELKSLISTNHPSFQWPPPKMDVSEKTQLFTGLC